MMNTSIYSVALPVLSLRVKVTRVVCSENLVIVAETPSTSPSFSPKGKCEDELNPRELGSLVKTNTNSLLAIATPLSKPLFRKCLVKDLVWNKHC